MHNVAYVKRLNPVALRTRFQAQRGSLLDFEPFFYLHAADLLEGLIGDAQLFFLGDSLPKVIFSLFDRHLSHWLEFVLNPHHFLQRNDGLF